MPRLLPRLPKQSLINWVGRAAKRRGYRIERSDGLEGLPHLDVFGLAAADLMNRGAGDPSPAFPFLLQVGAYDGFDEDPVRHLILKYGWSGLLVEPQPGAFGRLVENYQSQPNLQFANVALSDHDGATTLYMPETGGGPSDTSIQASFLESSIRRRVGDSAPVRRLEIPTRTVGSLMKEYSIPRIDILQVDTDGFDAEVVRMVLGSGQSPALIRYEHVHVGTDERRSLATLLAHRGYLLLRDGNDTIACQDGAGVDARFGVGINP